MRLAIMVGAKGRGSNMQAILRACKSGRLDAECGVVIAPREDVPAVSIAREMGAEVAVISPDESHYAEALLDILELERVDLLCLAGLTRLLPVEVVRAMPGRILNIHPALLPRHGGKGMYGLRVHQAVLDAGDKVSGCTVHYVTEEYDEGDILLQMTCPVEEDDTAETLAARVLELEHECYVKAIQMWIAHRYGIGRNASL
ncbi:MAG: phosphoribosylglycinamide formyltransferase [Fimbriimonadales bacterium]|nr:phosphoribosylglycinamide formyltransferase [Fimbriimonadales bacterium]